MTEPLTVKCPRCSNPVKWTPESVWRPFCSARCKQIDLGAWASESYRVPNATPPDTDDTTERLDN